MNAGFYRPPGIADVPLRTHENQEVRFYDDLIKEYLPPTLRW